MMRNEQEARSDGVLRDPIASGFFGRLAASLNEYADRHHLAVRRYQHNQPIWMFHFLHPKGGVGAIQLMYFRRVDEEEGRPNVCALWYFDDDAALVRHHHEPSPLEFMEPDVDAPTLMAAIERQLLMVLAWERSELNMTSPISGGRPKDEHGNPAGELEKRFRLPVVEG